MASPPEPTHRHQRNHLSQFYRTTALLFPPKTEPSILSITRVPLLFSNSSSESSQPGPNSPSSSKSAAVKGVSSGDYGSGFPSTVRIAGLNTNGKGGGPAFVGQVFSMCDLSGTGLMAVSTHFDVPFISKRTPEWLKNIFATITKSQRNGPVFRFFMDLGDAVNYVKRLNIPSGVVGACRLDLAYEHFKEKPHLFQFVPNERQVKAANKILKINAQNGETRTGIDGVPVFSAQNLDIAISTTDGIKWYTPYFFDKSMLDNILEDSVDQHFDDLIQTRHIQRRRDVMDDNIGSDILEEIGESLLEPPEIQEVMDEMGHSGIPFSVISKAAEIQLLYAVDKVFLGNRWLRRATGIQPKFPYVVDSFEKRSAFSIQRASEPTSKAVENEREDGNLEPLLENEVGVDHQNLLNFRFPFGDWIKQPWSKQQHKPQQDTRAEDLSRKCVKDSGNGSRFLPKITMVGISNGEAGQMNKASLKKKMEDITRELDQTAEDGSNFDSVNTNNAESEDRDPLFVANVGDYYTGMGRMGKKGLSQIVGTKNDSP